MTTKTNAQTIAGNRTELLAFRDFYRAEIEATQDAADGAGDLVLSEACAELRAWDGHPDTIEQRFADTVIEAIEATTPEILSEFRARSGLAEAGDRS